MTAGGLGLRRASAPRGPADCRHGTYIAGLQSKYDRVVLGVRDEHDVLPGRLWVEVYPSLPGEADALNVRPGLVTDQQDERTPRLWVVELDIDLAGGRDETHLDPYGR